MCDYFGLFIFVYYFVYTHFQLQQWLQQNNNELTVVHPMNNIIDTNERNAVETMSTNAMMEEASLNLTKTSGRSTSKGVKRLKGPFFILPKTPRTKQSATSTTIAGFGSGAAIESMRKKRENVEIEVFCSKGSLSHDQHVNFSKPKNGPRICNGSRQKTSSLVRSSVSTAQKSSNTNSPPITLKNANHIVKSLSSDRLLEKSVVSSMNEWKIPKLKNVQIASNITNENEPIVVPFG